MLTWAAAGPATSLAAAAAAALSSLVAQNEHAQTAALNVGALEKLLRCGKATPICCPVHQPQNGSRERARCASQRSEVA